MHDLNPENIQRLTLQITQDHSVRTLGAQNERIRMTYPLAFNMFITAVRTFLDKQGVRGQEREKCLTAATAGFVMLMLGFEEDQQPKRG